jgi:hypothetical protein
VGGGDYLKFFSGICIGDEQVHVIRQLEQGLRGLETLIHILPYKSKGLSSHTAIMKTNYINS